MTPAKPSSPAPAPVANNLRWLGGVLAGVSVLAVGGFVSYLQQQGADTATIAQIKEEIGRVREDCLSRLDQVDRNSQARRIEMRAEVLQIDAQRAREIDALRQEIRDMRDKR